MAKREKDAIQRMLAKNMLFPLHFGIKFIMKMCFLFDKNLNEMRFIQFIVATTQNIVLSLHVNRSTSNLKLW